MAEVAEAVLRRWREETPLVTAGRIHLNNAGASAQPLCVVDRMREHLRLECELGGYEAAQAVAPAVEETYRALAGLVGAEPRNVAIVDNATVAFWRALQAFDFEPGDVVLTTRNDYISNQLTFLALERRRGIRFLRAEDLPEGGVDAASVESLVRQHRPKLVALTWVPTNSGLVQPAAEIGRICGEAGVPYLVDACQAVGQMRVDAGSLRADFLCATGRKFLRGPRGTGFLFVSDRMLDEGRHPLYVDMRGARWKSADELELFPGARRFEDWEFAYALVLGLGEAARYAAEVGLDVIEARVRKLARHARERLRALPFARVLDRGAELCGIVTAEVAGVHAAEVVAMLHRAGINADASRVEYARLDMGSKGAESALRVSPHYFNTEEEIDALVEALERFARAGAR